jgi:hypothetical protein
MLKPRAQLFFPAGGKGETVTGGADARAAWQAYRGTPYAPEILADFPDLDLPMLQEYEPSATNGTYSISGFIDGAGRILGARASTKVLQTARSGTGMCFVASGLDVAALGGIEKVCRSIGYFGTFEVEFVRRDGVLQLIDFNPRYYGQMGFDIARGIPFPLLMHCAALGRTDLDSLVSRIHALDAPTLYRDRVAIAWWCGKALAGGALHGRELAPQRGPSRPPQARALDACWRRDDPVPAVVAGAALAWNALRHPLAFLRSLRKRDEICPSASPFSTSSTSAVSAAPTASA